MSRGNHNPPANAIKWSEEMLQTLTREFPVTLNNDLAAKLNVSPRTMHRKADELGLKKVPNFKELTEERRRELQSKAMKIIAKKNDGCFKKGQHACPEHEFKKGHGPLEPEKEAARRAKARATRNKTIYFEMLRLKYDRPQQTKMRIKKRYNIRCKYLEELKQ